MSLFQQVGAAGGAAVIAVTFIHPIDVVKTRMQVSGESGRKGGGPSIDYNKLGMGGTVGTIFKQEGPLAFWKGIPAAWLREASYTSLRLGLYAPIKTLIGADKPDSPFIAKFAAGSLAGGLGSIVGNPFDVLKTQLMASEGEASIVKTANSIFENRGIGGFYKGIDANIMRAMVLNGTKMACYDQIKGLVVEKTGLDKKALSAQFISAVGAGFFMTCTVTPFDMIRTRLMNQPPEAQMYSGFLDCGMKIVKHEGPAGLFKGFFPIWSRFAPTTCAQLIIFEQLRAMMGLDGI